MTGLWVLLMVLAAATAVGLWRRRVDGRLRAVPPVAVPAGADPGPDPGPSAARSPAAIALTADDLGADLGPRATLVQFSTSFCQPCRATRRILADVAGMVDGVTHVEVDAETRLDLVRRLGILRTPTVLVLDPAGAVRSRASGQPRKVDVIAALGTVA